MSTSIFVIVELVVCILQRDNFKRGDKFMCHNYNTSNIYANISTHFQFPTFYCISKETL